MFHSCKLKSKSVIEALICEIARRLAKAIQYNLRTRLIGAYYFPIKQSLVKSQRHVSVSLVSDGCIYQLVFKVSSILGY